MNNPRFSCSGLLTSAFLVGLAWAATRAGAAPAASAFHYGLSDRERPALCSSSLVAEGRLVYAFAQADTFLLGVLGACPEPQDSLEVLSNVPLRCEGLAVEFGEPKASQIPVSEMDKAVAARRGAPAPSREAAGIQTVSWSPVSCRWNLRVTGGSPGVTPSLVLLPLQDEAAVRALENTPNMTFRLSLPWDTRKARLSQGPPPAIARGRAPHASAGAVVAAGNTVSIDFSRSRRVQDPVVRIIDVMGRCRVELGKSDAPGHYVWNLLDGQGRGIPNGVYYAVGRSGGQSDRVLRIVVDR